MNKYLPCCAPEESHKTINAVETSCCFWSLPCFAVCPTRLFDECCPSNVSAERVCRFATAGFAIATCLAGLGWLWIPTAAGATTNDPISMDDFYADVVFVVVQTALSQVGTWALEIAALVLSMLVGLGTRCVWGICIDCGYHGFVSQFEEDASMRPSIDVRSSSSSNDYSQFVDGVPESPMATKAVPK